jgi:hypothetical protein
MNIHTSNPATHSSLNLIQARGVNHSIHLLDKAVADGITYFKVASWNRLVREDRLAGMLGLDRVSVLRLRVGSVRLKAAQSQQSINQALLSGCVGSVHFITPSGLDETAKQRWLSAGKSVRSPVDNSKFQRATDA